MARINCMRLSTKYKISLMIVVPCLCFMTYALICQRHSFMLIRAAYPAIPHTLHYEFTMAWNGIRTTTPIDPDVLVISPLWRLPIDEINRNAVKGALLDYLPDFKSPCWFTKTVDEDGLRCLPYFYVAGVAKSGTTALYKQLVKHPDIESPAIKEPYFWTYPQRRNFVGYLNLMTNAKRNIYRKSSDGYHNKITFEATSNYLVFNGPIDKYKTNMVSGEPRYTLPHTLYALNPNTRIIVTMRNPTDRLLSDYHFHSFITVIGFGKEYSMEQFHKLVNNSITMMEECFASRTVRSCAYDSDLITRTTHGGQLKLTYGMYHPYVAEWMSVFPQNQIMFVKAEELYAQASVILEEAFHFLDLDTPPALLEDIHSEMSAIYHKERSADTSGQSYRTEMWPETRQLLDDFYTPFNQQLSLLLKDTKWLFK